MTTGTSDAAPAGWDAERVALDTRDGPLDQLADVVLSRILSRVGARTVFGEPVTHGDTTVVPVAKVASRFGFGGGMSAGKAGEEGDPAGSGMGGGGDVRAKPLGYIEIDAHGSRFVAIEDSMEIGLAAVRFFGVVMVLVALRFLLRRSGQQRNRHSAELPVKMARDVRNSQVARKTAAGASAFASKAQARLRRAS